MTAFVILISALGGWAVLRRRRSSRAAPMADPRRVLGSVAANLARGASAGMTPAESLSVAAERFGGPVGEQLSKVRDALVRGVPLDRALLDWVARERNRDARRFARDPSATSDDVELLVCAIRFAEPRGAGLVDAFEGVATALVDRAELVGEVRALTSQAWASVVVLCSLPVVGLAMVAMIAPSVPAALLGTRPGLACLAVAALLDLAAVATARRLVSGVLR